MTFSDDLDAIFGLDELCRAATLIPGSGPARTVRVQFRPEHVRGDFDGSKGFDTEFTALIRTSEMATRGDVLTVGADEFSVVRVESDGTGLDRLILKAR